MNKSKNQLDEIVRRYSAKLRAALNDDSELDSRINSFMADAGFPNYVHPMQRTEINHPVREGGLDESVSIADVKKIRDLLRFAFGFDKGKSNVKLDQRTYELFNGVYSQGPLERSYTAKELRQSLVKAAEYEAEYGKKHEWE